MPEFYCFVDAKKPDVIVGTESWLSPDICDSEVLPCDYMSLRADRTLLEQGGERTSQSRDQNIE